MSSDLYVLDLNTDVENFDTSLLSLRSLTIQKHYCKSKILYGKKKLAFKFSTEGEVVEHKSHKYYQLSYPLTPIEEEKLLTFERRIMKLMSAKLQKNNIVKSGTEAFDLFQSRIINDHETSVFLTKSSPPENIPEKEFLLIPTDIKFQTGKTMLIDFDIEPRVGGVTEDKPPNLENDENVIDRSIQESMRTEVHIEAEDEGDKEEDDKEGQEGGIGREEGRAEAGEGRGEAEEGTGEEQIDEDIEEGEDVLTDVNIEYMECVELARNALIELKTRQDKIKRALLRYVDCAGSYLSQKSEKGRKRITLKDRTKYVEKRDKLRSFIA